MSFKKATIAKKEGVSKDARILASASRKPAAKNPKLKRVLGKY